MLAPDRRERLSKLRNRASERATAFFQTTNPQAPFIGTALLKGGKNLGPLPTASLWFDERESENDVTLAPLLTSEVLQTSAIFFLSCRTFVSAPLIGSKLAEQRRPFGTTLPNGLSPLLPSDRRI